MVTSPLRREDRPVRMASTTEWTQRLRELLFVPRLCGTCRARAEATYTFA